MGKPLELHRPERPNKNLTDCRPFALLRRDILWPHRDQHADAVNLVQATSHARDVQNQIDAIFAPYPKHGVGYLGIGRSIAAEHVLSMAGRVAPKSVVSVPSKVAARMIFVVGLGKVAVLASLVEEGARGDPFQFLGLRAVLARTLFGAPIFEQRLGRLKTDRISDRVRYFKPLRIIWPFRDRFQRPPNFFNRIFPSGSRRYDRLV